MSLIIKSIEYYLPEKIVTNEDMQLKHPQWDIEKLGQKSGVFSRHIAGISETAFDLAREALKKMFQSSKIEKSEIDGIVFCTQSPDFIMPGNSFLIHKEFGFDSRVWSFDYNLACSGFIYGLAITRGMIATGLGKNILLINADTYSRFINRDDRSTSILFGDGATVTIISSTDKTGIIDLDLASEGSSYDYFYIPAGGSRLPSDDSTGRNKVDEGGNIRSMNNIHMNGFGVWKFISRIVPIQIESLLKRNKLLKDDIDLFIFHQASKLTIDSLVKALNVDSQKVYMNIEQIGNTVSASIPLAIKQASEEGRLNRGDLVLLSGFGVGISWGSLILRY